jgi:hypothetical protein
MQQQKGDPGAGLRQRRDIQEELGFVDPRQGGGDTTLVILKQGGGSYLASLVIGIHRNR